MADFLLIHGAWHGAWCWSKLIPALEALGHRAVAIDLPAQGDDPTPSAETTLALWAGRVVAALEGFAAPPILVGHSMGGLSMTAAAEAAPARIAALVYLAAFLPQDGDSLFSMAAAHDPARAVLRNQVAPDGITSMPEEATIVPAFYADCDAADIAYARARFRPLPLRPAIDKIHVTPERFGSVPRAYIECTDDRAIPIENQRQMVAASPCYAVRSLAAGHSPFYSMPDRLASVLAEIAGLKT